MQRINVGHIVLYLFVFFLTTQGYCEEKRDAQEKGGLSVILELKSETEQQARRLKRDYKENTPEFKNGESLYIDAKKKADVWIDTLIIDLRKESKSEMYNKSVEDVSKNSAAFINYVKELEEPHIKESKFEKLSASEIEKMVIDVGLKIWAEWRKSSKERRDEIVQELEKIKWKNFDEI